jgi:hypothetical protein
MTENTLPNESKNQKKKTSKKEKMAIRKDNHNREMIKRVWKSWLYASPVFFGFMALAISISLGCFIMGWAGVILIVKKEMPSAMVTVRRTWAVIVGILFTILCWTGSLHFLWVEITVGWWGF